MNRQQRRAAERESGKHQAGGAGSATVRANSRAAQQLLGLFEMEEAQHHLSFHLPGSSASAPHNGIGAHTHKLLQSGQVELDPQDALKRTVRLTRDGFVTALRLQADAKTEAGIQAISDDVNAFFLGTQLDEANDALRKCVAVLSDLGAATPAGIREALEAAQHALVADDRTSARGIMR